jgi:zinc transport system substrate-binding protein
MDPHIWLSPKLVMFQAEAMRDSLVELYPGKKDIFDANLEKFKSELKNLDKKIREILSGSEGSVFLVFHPSWGYFADDYGLVQVAIEKEGKEPSAEYMARLMEFAKKKKIKAIFVQEQFSKQYAQNIAKALNIKVVSLDPLSPDYFANLIEVAEALKKK